jgi:hypothetical protein
MRWVTPSAKRPGHVLQSVWQCNTHPLEGHLTLQGLVLQHPICCCILPQLQAGHHLAGQRVGVAGRQLQDCACVS